MKKYIQTLLGKFGYKIIKIRTGSGQAKFPPIQIPVHNTYHAYYHGVDFLCPADSVLGQWVLAGKTWDPHFVPLIERCRRDNEDFTVCEVGSNIGASIVPVMAQFPHDQFILIEASPFFGQYLKHNTQFFPSTQLEIHNTLLSDAAGELETLVENNTTAGRTRSGPYGINREYRLTSTTLDNLIGDRKIDFLKVDTDGFEFPILRGARQILAQQRPNLLVEFTPEFLREQNETPQDFLNWVLQFGYQRIEVFDNLGTSLGEMSAPQIIAVAENSPNQAGYVDLFFCR